MPGVAKTTGSILREGDQAERGMCESVNCHRRTHMASPLVIFAAGMGTAALSLGLGYATLYVPDGSQPSKTQIILANRPEPPPPTVEKVKREPRPVVAAIEPPPAPTVTSRETPGTGNGWVKEAHQTAETPKAPAAPTVPHVGPAAAPVAPPPGAAPPVAAAPAQPVTADMRPASVQAPVKVEQNKPTVELSSRRLKGWTESGTERPGCVRKM